MTPSNKSKREDTGIDGVELFRWLEADQALSEPELEAWLHGEGFQTFRWHDVAGVKYPSHCHDHDECIWIADGEIVFNVKETSLHLKKGDRVYFPKGTEHTAEVPKHTAVTYYVGRK